MKKVYVLCLIISIVSLSCKSEYEKKLAEQRKNELRAKEVIGSIKKIFSKKYNLIDNWDTIHFDYTYDCKKYFLNPNKLVLIEGEVSDFDITNKGNYRIFLCQGTSPAITFVTKCSKEQFNYLYKNKKHMGVFIIKMKNIDRVWFDLEVDNEEIYQTFSSDLVATDSLIAHQVVK